MNCGGQEHVFYSTWREHQLSSKLLIVSRMGHSRKDSRKEPPHDSSTTRPLLVDCCGVLWLCLKIRGTPPFSSMVIIIFPMFFNSYDWGVY
jgi:hypothetical protein